MSKYEIIQKVNCQQYSDSKLIWKISIQFKYYVCLLSVSKFSKKKRIKFLDKWPVVIIQQMTHVQTISFICLVVNDINFTFKIKRS